MKRTTGISKRNETNQACPYVDTCYLAKNGMQFIARHILKHNA